jgi:SAM-dependent methyltransferase
MSASTPVPTKPMPSAPYPLGRTRLGYRWSRYLLWSLGQAHTRGLRDATVALAHLGWLTTVDLIARPRTVSCNICGWEGRRFYPNTGSGYFELDSNCPRCGCINRYRSLAALLDARTGFFSPDKAVIEVAPVRGFQAYCLWRKEGMNYLSFDLEKFGMEKGDLTAMRYADASCDYFLCFHVLEHVPADVAAVREIYRVLRPGGSAVLQVPIDWSLQETVEYGKPNPLETGHVRRYSEKGFARRLAGEGFAVSTVSVGDLFPESEILRHGFNREPIFFAVKPA